MWCYIECYEHKFNRIPEKSRSFGPVVLLCPEGTWWSWSLPWTRPGKMSSRKEDSEYDWITWIRIQKFKKLWCAQVIVRWPARLGSGGKWGLIMSRVSQCWLDSRFRLWSRWHGDELLQSRYCIFYGILSSRILKQQAQINRCLYMEFHWMEWAMTLYTSA